ncbi:phosphopantetheine-binding protein [Rhodococcus daqingensis]|uniref:Phosphopantetheine-binding protein n=1 Tax=Rhodococcus daqingensis TaxID=2479363 RepID=A0ABW2S405_9NOCA
MTADGTDTRVFDEVVCMLTEVIGADFLLDVEITGSTTFNDDLAMESIEFVALGEKLQQRYGERVNFVEFVADMDLDEIMAMNMDRLVSYIEQCLAHPSGPR